MPFCTAQSKSKTYLDLALLQKTTGSVVSTSRLGRVVEVLAPANKGLLILPYSTEHCWSPLQSKFELMAAAVFEILFSLLGESAVEWNDNDEKVSSVKARNVFIFGCNFENKIRICVLIII